jgi:hypothetical protein
MAANEPREGRQLQFYQGATLVLTVHVDSTDDAAARTLGEELGVASGRLTPSTAYTTRLSSVQVDANGAPGATAQIGLDTVFNTPAAETPGGSGEIP